jgi:hypothetical protein
MVGRAVEKEEEAVKMWSDPFFIFAPVSNSSNVPYYEKISECGEEYGGQMRITGDVMQILGYSGHVYSFTNMSHTSFVGCSDDRRGLRDANYPQAAIGFRSMRWHPYIHGGHTEMRVNSYDGEEIERLVMQSDGGASADESTLRQQWSSPPGHWHVSGANTAVIAMREEMNLWTVQAESESTHHGMDILMFEVWGSVPPGCTRQGTIARCRGDEPKIANLVACRTVSTGIADIWLTTNIAVYDHPRCLASACFRACGSDPSCHINCWKYLFG